MKAKQTGLGLDGGSINTENAGEHQAEYEGRIEKLVFGGAGLLRHPDLGVCFICDVLLGELVRFRVPERGRVSANGSTKASNHQGFLQAELLEILEPSEQRIVPQCIHYAACGGCDWQHIRHPAQLEFKEQIVLENLQRLAARPTGLQTQNTDNVERQGYAVTMLPTIAEYCPVAGADPDQAGWAYRQRAKFFGQKSGDGNWQLGFRAKGSRKLIAVPECLVIAPKIQEALYDQQLALEYLRSGKDTLAEGLERSPELPGSELYVFATEEGCTFNAEEFCYSWHGVELRSQAHLFFQNNAKTLPLLLDELNLRLGPILANWQAAFCDLYAGVGLFSLCFAKLLPEAVTGKREKPYFAVERNPETFAYLERNLSGTNFQCYKGDVGAFLKKTMRHNRKVLEGSFIFADPSRSGLSNAVAQRLNASGAQYIVYLSCNAASFARDMGRLQQNYDIEFWRLVDFYPQTHHIETLALLKKRR